MIPRIYVDTSVFGGCFDEEYKTESLRIFEDVRNGKFILVISTVTVEELDRAPKHVQKVLADLPEKQVEIIEFSDRIGQLRDAYVQANILDVAHRADAEHIASASVAEVDFVVSWNFRHIVHYDKIAGFQRINVIKGYNAIAIYSPKEVVE